MSISPSLLRYPIKNLGQNIVLYKSYYLYDDEEKRDVLRHEFVHARQQSKYGVGGGREELNMADIEAEANANAGEESEYWFYLKIRSWAMMI